MRPPTASVGCHARTSLSLNQNCRPAGAAGSATLFRSSRRRCMDAPEGGRPWEGSFSAERLATWHHCLGASAKGRGAARFFPLPALMDVSAWGRKAHTSRGLPRQHRDRKRWLQEERRPCYALVDLNITIVACAWRHRLLVWWPGDHQQRLCAVGQGGVIYMHQAWIHLRGSYRGATRPTP